jgi:16S rRNA (uracil1498-N3)-methyltransferase
MNLFYTEKSRVQPPVLYLDGQEAQHAVKVMRLREGAPVQVTDGEGMIYSCVIRSLTKSSVTAEITGSGQIKPEEPHITVVLGLIKKRDRLEFALEKCTELGANAFIVFRGDHSEKENVRVERLETAVLSAMKQSLRAYLPPVTVASSLDEALEGASDNTQLLMADETEASGAVKQQPASESRNKVMLIVGPEGGFSERERKLLEKLNSKKVSLGSYRLRAETAAIAFTDRVRMREF